MSTTHERTQDRIKVMQLNVNKSDLCMHDLLHSAASDADIIAIQEPYIDFLGRTRALRHLHVVYPPRHRDQWEQVTTRSIILVNDRLLTDSWTALEVDHPDVTAVQLVGDFGTLRIFNIYNDCNNDEAV
ncbi:hypothetical protein EV360DRAFT_32505, partial [Lentinula raphanica]